MKIMLISILMYEDKETLDDCIMSYKCQMSN